MVNWKRFFTEEHREKRRIQQERYRVTDILWYSSVYDYRTVRLIYNFPIGICLCSAIYQFGWQRLNFADFHPVYAELFKWSLILGASLAFALSPVFRCAAICVCVGGLGKSGQGVLSLYIAEQLNQGPIANILHNFELTSNIIICHLELEADLVSQRIRLTTGPLEALFERHFGASTMFGKKVVKMLKTLVEPFRDELRFSTDEDESLAAAIDGSEALSERESLVVDGLNSTNSSTNETLRPAWTKLKTELGRNAGRRAQQRCEQTFAASVRRCHEVFAETQAKCYDNLPIIGLLLCRQFNALEICQPAKIQEFSEKRCKFGTEMEESGALSSDLDDQMESVENISRQLNDQLKMNLHFKAVEEPQDERMRILSEIKSQIKSDVKFFQLVSKTINELLSTLLIMLIYCIFRDSIQMIRSYLSNIEFKNHYLTSYFWYIDDKRRLEGKPFLRPLTHSELKRHGLKSPFSPPSGQEIRQSWQPLLRFFITVFIVITVLLMDHYFYRVLFNVTTFGKIQATQQGVHNVDIHVDGHGPVADMIRSIVDFNFTREMSREISNRVCISEPRAPDWSSTTVSIILPLLAMLLLQVVFNYAIRRLVLFYVVGFIFRRRSKARIVQLYNKILIARENDRRVGCIRIRYLVQKRRLRQKMASSRWVLAEDNFLRRHIFDKFFATVRCLLCEDKYRSAKVMSCSECPATYCLACAESMGNECYACKAQYGDASAKQTHTAEESVENQRLKQSHPSTNIVDRL